MSQVFAKNGMVTDDLEAFLDDLRQGLKPRCKYCRNMLDGKRTNAKFCGPVCYARHKGGKHKHGEAPTHCAHCGDAIVGRKFGAKYCGIGCRILGGRELAKLRP